MITLCQHIPNFAKGFTPKMATGETIAEVLATDWVKAWQRDDWTVRDGKRVIVHRFTRWSTSDSTLMAEFDEGKWWMVVGFLSSDVPGPIDLPKWEPRY